MALFDDILADVYTLTNRPDLVAESKLGIRAATLKLHGLEFWREDRVEDVLSVSVADNTFVIAKGALIYPLRHVDYIKKGASDVYFDEVAPKNILDGYGYRRTNIYYRAGDNFNFLCDTGETYIIFSYYKQPVATETGYDSWIASLYPLTVAVEAAIFVFSAIGDKEQEARMENMAQTNLAILQINHLDAA
jgi:hypothetical protein